MVQMCTAFLILLTSHSIINHLCGFEPLQTGDILTKHEKTMCSAAQQWTSPALLQLCFPAPAVSARPFCRPLPLAVTAHRYRPSLPPAVTACPSCASQTSDVCSHVFIPISSWKHRFLHVVLPSSKLCVGGRRDAGLRLGSASPSVCCHSDRLVLR